MYEWRVDNIPLLIFGQWGFDERRRDEGSENYRENGLSRSNCVRPGDAKSME
jgi:hypothetical protein